MTYSPKLKIAIEEIKQILKKHDIAASVIIHTPGFSEYLHHINTSYSCAFFEGDNLRVKAKLQDFNGDKKAQQKKIADTLNMVTHFGDVGGMVALNFLKMEEMIKAKVDVDEDKGSHTGHTQQNN